MRGWRIKDKGEEEDEWEGAEDNVGGNCVRGE